MKKALIILIASAILSSCKTSHKGCRGKANWYGNRNLSTIQVDSTLLVIKFYNESKNK